MTNRQRLVYGAGLAVWGILGGWFLYPLIWGLVT